MPAVRFIAFIALSYFEDTRSNIILAQDISYVSSLPDGYVFGICMQALISGVPAHLDLPDLKTAEPAITGTAVRGDAVSKAPHHT